MEVQILRYALEVAKASSISRAAKNLYIGQPSLSKAIRDLEQNLGFSVFKRTSQGVTPTEKGREFLTYAQKVIAQIEEINSIYRQSNEKTQRFSISVPRSSYIVNAFTKTVASMRLDEAIEASIFETNSLQVIKNVVDDESRMGIIRYRDSEEPYFLQLLEERNLSAQPVWTFQYWALMSSNHPLANKTPLLYEDLSNYIEITHRDLIIPYLPHDKEKAQHKSSKAKIRRVEVVERGSQFDLLYRVPITYMWVSHMPKDLLHRNSLVQKKCEGQTSYYKDMLIYPHNYHMNEYDLRLIENLKRSVEEVSQYNDTELVTN